MWKLSLQGLAAMRLGGSLLSIVHSVVGHRCLCNEKRGSAFVRTAKEYGRFQAMYMLPLLVAMQFLFLCNFLLRF